MPSALEDIVDEFRRNPNLNEEAVLERLTIAATKEEEVDTDLFEKYQTDIRRIARQRRQQAERNADATFPTISDQQMPSMGGMGAAAAAPDEKAPAHPTRVLDLENLRQLFQSAVTTQQLNDVIVGCNELLKRQNLASPNLRHIRAEAIAKRDELLANAAKAARPPAPVSSAGAAAYANDERAHHSTPAEMQVFGGQQNVTPAVAEAMASSLNLMPIQLTAEEICTHALTIEDNAQRMEFLLSLSNYPEEAAEMIHELIQGCVRSIEETTAPVAPAATIGNTAVLGEAKQFSNNSSNNFNLPLLIDSLEGALETATSNQQYQDIIDDCNRTLELVDENRELLSIRALAKLKQGTCNPPEVISELLKSNTGKSCYFALAKAHAASYKKNKKNETLNELITYASKCVDTDEEDEVIKVLRRTIKICDLMESRDFVRQANAIIDGNYTPDVAAPAVAMLAEKKPTVPAQSLQQVHLPSGAAKLVQKALSTVSGPVDLRAAAQGSNPPLAALVSTFSMTFYDLKARVAQAPLIEVEETLAPVAGTSGPVVPLGPT